MDAASNASLSFEIKQFEKKFGSAIVFSRRLSNTIFNVITETQRKKKKENKNHSSIFWNVINFSKFQSQHLIFLHLTVSINQKNLFGLTLEITSSMLL